MVEKCQKRGVQRILSKTIRQMIKCILENGRETSFRHITVNTLAVNEQQEILLIKRAQGLLRGGKYSTPGGFLDRDENFVRM